jgi:eukaryotic-like serine/threonine-protein kinase
MVTSQLMPAPGTTIGPYEVDREIGRGGMGVVFLAHDTRLGRAVALKALPEDVSSDSDRLQRFEREARVLASLSHPNVAAIFGVEESEGRRYLALEHIEGETLADKLVRGPLPLRETLDICLQIAAGVEAAHEGGVIHRDLKPANVMVTPNDQVKVLDFGLAKGTVATDESGLAKSPVMVASRTPSSPTLSSPTIPPSPTVPGVILGTLPYLSPEQARGKAVDRRTDIWSFGCILYECLTGQRAFGGETISDTIAKILERDLDFSVLPKSTPARLRELLEGCLAKDPKRRLRDIGDARITLEGVKSGRFAGTADAATTSASKARAAILLAVGAIAGIIIGVLAWNSLGSGSRATHGPPTFLSVAIPPDVRVTSEFTALGGRALVFLGETRATKDAEPISRLYVRRLDRDSLEPIRGTERAYDFSVSPDGRWILYLAPASERSAQIRLFKTPVDASSPPVPLAEVGQNWAVSAPTWLESGDILVSVDDGSKYLRIPKGGGPPTEPLEYGAAGFRGRFTRTFQALPGDRGVLLDANSYEGGVYHLGVGVLDLRSGKAKVLIRDGASPRYSPTGHLLFTRQDALYAVPFDLNGLRVKGEPVAVLDGLLQLNNMESGTFDVAPDGTLFYPPGGDVTRNRHLVIVDPGGKVSEWSGEREAVHSWVSVAKDGRRCAQIITSAKDIDEIWISERGRPASYRLPTGTGADCRLGAWSPDGSRLAYYQGSQSADDGIYISNADGLTPPRLLARRPSATGFLAPLSWSPDGSTILAVLVAGGDVPHGYTIAVPTNPGPPVEARPWGRDDTSQGPAYFSPSGHAIAYMSLDTGKFEILVSQWNGNAPVGRPLPVSIGGGVLPYWSRDGKRLYYQTQMEKVMAVDITEEPELRASAPSEVWDLGALRVAPGNLGTMMDLLPDGRLLAVQRGEDEGNPTRVNVVLNFPDILGQRMRAAGR